MQARHAHSDLHVDSFINALSTAGDKEYGDWLNFRVGYTVTKGHQLIIDSKVWHLAVLIYVYYYT